MAYISQGESNTYTNSYAIDIWTHVSNVLTDVAELSFRIFDISSGAKKTEYQTGNKNNVQIYPTTPGQRQSVNVSALVTDVPAGHKISTGHYYAPWTCSSNESPGDHIIEWYFRRSPTANERSFAEEFVVTTTPIVPVVGQCLINTEDVRRYMRDYVYKNILLDAYESTDEDIMAGIDMTVDRFNIMTPMTTYNCKNFPSRYLLLIGVASHLLCSVSFEQLRNQLSYNDGNIHVGIHDKHQLYLAAGKAGWQEFDTFARAAKNQINMEGGYGDLGSPYVWRFSGNYS